MSSDANDRPNMPEPRPEEVSPTSEDNTPAEARPSEPSTESSAEQTSPPKKPRVLIGSQRDPAAFRRRGPRDWTPVESPEPQSTPEETAPAPSGPTSGPDEPAPDLPPSAPSRAVAQEETPGAFPEEAQSGQIGAPPPAEKRSFPPPSLRGQLSPDLEEEFNEAMEDVAMDELLAGSETLTRQDLLEPESRHTGRVISIHREDVFVELGGREQGTTPLKQFAEPPEPGSQVEVIVVRFQPEDGLYELMIPHAAASVGDWSDLREGMIVEARVTGHNAGGLECEVNHIRGFIPVSQISLYRVEDLAQFVDEKFNCLVTEANPERRNLVLSRRAVLEREQEQARQELLASLEPGQVHEGVVRKLMDFGAFVDLGSGVDGLLHISQLSWARVNHPSDVLSEGQSIKVKIEKFDPATGKISLGYRDMLANPWDDVERNYPVNTVVKGTVTKLMEFGAFVQLEPGVEGLVHISELSHKRVPRASDVVSEGDEVEVMIKSVDLKAQRIGLSMKDVLPAPEEETPSTEEAPEPAPAAKPSNRPAQPLKGGLGGATGGERFGLKW